MKTQRRALVFLLVVLLASCAAVPAGPPESRRVYDVLEQNEPQGSSGDLIAFDDVPAWVKIALVVGLVFLMAALGTLAISGDSSPNDHP